MPLAVLDRHLAQFQFSETHFRDVTADGATVMRAAAAYRPDDDPFFRAMIGLRELPMRAAGRLRRTETNPPPAFGLHNFTLIENEPGEALVYGLVGRFWESGYGLASVEDAEAFRRFDRAGVPKLALGIWVEPLESGKVRLFTQTRVFCPDGPSRRRFAPYWYLIRPVSGLIRGRILRSIAAASERGA